MLRKGNLVEARRYFNESVSIAPFFARAVWKLGKVEGFLGNNTRAQELIERAIELDPTLPFTYAVHNDHQGEPQTDYCTRIWVLLLRNMIMIEPTACSNRYISCLSLMA